MPWSFAAALGLFGDAKQAMGEGKSDMVETGLTGLVATALYSHHRGLVKRLAMKE